jgi:putative endonuclease
MRAGRDRRRAVRFGRRAEDLCVAWLRLKGYRILARDLRFHVGEIDIVARRGRALAFVEVKSRVDAATADALGAHQRRRIVRAAEAFLQRRPELAQLDLRFDLMLIAPWRRPRHLVAAWRADD